MDYLFKTSLIIIITIFIVLLIFSYFIWNISNVINKINIMNMFRGENIFKRKRTEKKVEFKNEEKLENVKGKDAEKEQQKKVDFKLVFF